MLEIQMKENTWKPPVLFDFEIERIADHRRSLVEDWQDYIVFIRLFPYIDMLFVRENDSTKETSTYRFVFGDGYTWDQKQEKRFMEICLGNDHINFSYADMNEIYQYYSSKYPEWHLKRYHTDSIRMLDHIYHCMRKNTVKELLYKSGLDELAYRSNGIDAIDLLSSSPSEIYGLNIRIIRAMNCEVGAEILNEGKYRIYLKNLNYMFPDVFSHPMNDAQCRYLKYLIDGELTVGEVGRLYLSRRPNLSGIWCDSLYDLFMIKDIIEEEWETIRKIDPIYKKYLDNKDKTTELRRFLLYGRKDYDKKIRRSNRKRDYDWQERDKGYVVRYPQTSNDFCREAVYMKNCLLTYMEAYIENDTTILFMRTTENFNKPFITIEIYENRLTQAYHRCDQDCTKEEAEWIRQYCRRHGIDIGKFAFNTEIDDLA